MTQYLNYGVHSKSSVVEDRDIEYPKIIICLNSMHSKRAVELKYPFLTKTIGLLYIGFAKIYLRHPFRCTNYPLANPLKE